jgi:hypothetical protein
VSARAWFDAIIVPTHRPVEQLRAGIGLAKRTRRPLIVMCSRSVNKDGVIEQATAAGVEAFAFNLPPGNPLNVDFTTSQDTELSAASPGKTSDLSMKRNIGLVLARLLGWERLMFLDDDIYGVSQRHVTELAAALDSHSVSALIPNRGFPDNSVVCHARRLGGKPQDVFASASGIGVRCDRSDLAFFPNVYNEDWFFFADEAASLRIARVGESRQRIYDPYDSPDRATWEEFGDLLAEGLYARLDNEEGIWDVDADYWQYFIEKRQEFHLDVLKSLDQVDDPQRQEATRAARSVRAAQDQLGQIKPPLCMKFMHHWKEDLAAWREYLAELPGLGSVEDAFDHLKIPRAAQGRSAVTSLLGKQPVGNPEPFLVARTVSRV